MGAFEFNSSNYSNSVLDGGMSTYGKNTPLSYGSGFNANNQSLGSFTMENGYNSQPLNLQTSPYSTMGNYGGNPGEFYSSSFGNGNNAYNGSGLANTFNNTPTPAPTGNIMSSFLQQPDGSGGYGAAGLGIAQSLGNAYFAYEGLKSYKAATKETKRQFDMNYGASRQEYNTRLRDRQTARNAANPGTQSVDSYMNENQIA